MLFSLFSYIWDAADDMADELDQLVVLELLMEVSECMEDIVLLLEEDEDQAVLLLEDHEEPECSRMKLFTQLRSIKPGAMLDEALLVLFLQFE